MRSLAFLILGLTILSGSCRSRSNAPASSGVSEGEVKRFSDSPRISAADIQRIYDIGALNNHTWPLAKLTEAFNSGKIDAIAVYSKEGEMLGYVLFHNQKDIYLHIYDVSLDPKLENTRPTLEALARSMGTLAEKNPALFRISPAHTDQVGWAGAIGFDAVLKVGDSPVPPTTNEAGDVNYEPRIYKLGDAKPAVVSDFAENGRAVARLKEVDLLAEDAETIARIKGGFADMKQRYARFKDLDRDVKTINKDIERAVISALLQRETGSYILLGDKGDGKSYTLDRVMAQLARGVYDSKVVQRLGKDYMQLKVDPATLLANSTYRGQFETKMKALIARSDSIVIVMYSDEIQRLALMDPDIFDQIKEAQAKGRIKVIGSTTIQEYYDTFFGRDAVIDRFYVDFFPVPTRSQVVAILEYHFKKTGLKASGSIEAIGHALFDWAEVGDPNGGRVRSKKKLLDAIEAEMIQDDETSMSVALVERVARRIYKLENVVMPGQLPALLPDLNNRIAAAYGATPDADLTQALRNMVIGSMGAVPSNHMALVLGPTNSGRTHVSETVAKVLGRKHKAFNLGNPIYNHRKITEDLHMLITDPRFGGPFCVVAFEGFDQASPEVQFMVLDIVKKGSFLAEVIDGHTKKKSTREIKIPNVLFHLIATEEDGIVPEVRSQIPNDVTITVRSAEQQQMVSGKALDQVIAGNDRLNTIDFSAEAKAEILRRFNEKYSDAHETSYEKNRSRLEVIAMEYAAENNLMTGGLCGAFYGSAKISAAAKPGGNGAAAQ